MKKSLTPVLITLSVVVVLLSYYFFMYLPTNERDLRSQRFRVLENIDVNIQTKISNSTALLENLLKDYLKENLVYKNALDRYIQNFPQQNFELLPIQRIGADNFSSAKTTSSQAMETTIRFDANSQNFALLLTKNSDQKLKAEDSLYRIGIRSSLQRFVAPLLPDNIFDEYLIMQGDQVVWESFPSGIISADSDSIFISDKGIVGGGVRSISARGKGYKMFLQPVKFGGSTNLVIAGLLSDEHYSKEKKQLQMSVLMLLATIVIIIIVSFPWLKLYQMGSKDMLTITDGIGSLVVAILLCSLFFFVFFKYNLRLRSDHTQDSKKNLANTISNTLNKEINGAYNALDRLDKISESNPSLQANTRNIENANAERGNLYLGECSAIPGTRIAAIKNITIPAYTDETFWICKLP